MSPRGLPSLSDIESVESQIGFKQQKKKKKKSIKGKNHVVARQLECEHLVKTGLVKYIEKLKEQVRQRDLTHCKTAMLA